MSQTPNDGAHGASQPPEGSQSDQNPWSTPSANQPDQSAADQQQSSESSWGSSAGSTDWGSSTSGSEQGASQSGDPSTYSGSDYESQPTQGQPGQPDYGQQGQQQWGGQDYGQQPPSGQGSAGSYDQGQQQPYGQTSAGGYDQGQQQPYGQTSAGGYDQGQQQPYGQTSAGGYDQGQQQWGGSQPSAGGYDPAQQQQWGQQDPQAWQVQSGAGGYAGQGGFPGGGDYDPKVPATYQPNQPPPVPGAMPASPSDEKTWSTVAHVLMIFTGFLGPLIVYLIYKDRSRWLKVHSVEALNFGILATIVQVISVILYFVVIGAFTQLAMIVLQIIFGILGAMAANRGEYKPYPFNVRMIK